MEYDLKYLKMEDDIIFLMEDDLNIMKMEDNLKNKITTFSWFLSNLGAKISWGWLSSPKPKPI